MGAYSIEYWPVGAVDKRTLVAFEDGAGTLFTPKGAVIDIASWINPDPRLTDRWRVRHQKTMVFMTPTSGAAAGKRVIIGTFLKKEFLPDAGYIATPAPAKAPEPVKAPEPEKVAEPVKAPEPAPALVTVVEPKPLDVKKIIVPGAVGLLLLWMAFK